MEFIYGFFKKLSVLVPKFLDSHGLASFLLQIGISNIEYLKDFPDIQDPDPKLWDSFEGKLLS